MIISYVKGTRKKFINPVSFFAISLSISGLYLFILGKFFPNAMDFSPLVEDEAQQKFTQDFANLVADYISLFYFALIPLLAFISWVVFYRKKFNFTEHIVIYLYTMSLGAVITTVLAIIILLIKPDLLFTFSLFSNLGLVLFHCYLLKRLFQLNWKQLILKTLFFIFIFGISYVIISITVGLILVRFTDINLQDFAPPPKS